MPSGKDLSPLNIVGNTPPRPLLGKQGYQVAARRNHVHFPLPGANGDLAATAHADMQYLST